MEVQADTFWTRFIWTVHDFSTFPWTKQSDIIMVGNYKWRIVIFPGDNEDDTDQLSIRLEVVDLPDTSRVYAEFVLSVVNQSRNQYTLRKEKQYRFSARENECDFTQFMSLNDLYDPARGYLVNDMLIIEAEISVRDDFGIEMGYVGLVNHGETSCLNSLLQTLYHIPYLRKAVYKIPTMESDTSSRSLPLALQRLFYDLQYSRNSVSTEELTTYFEWNTHDVQELNGALCEKLEDAMKGTVSEGTIEELFEGHQMNLIECIDVNYESNRRESFYDLQLDVRDCEDVYASFDKYVRIERLEGGNKYHTEEHGLQDAMKSVLFMDFPPVLQLQLKRFEYDFTWDTTVKINDRYEFPLELDLDIENGKYLSPDADRSIRNLYTLHSVLVHSSGEHGGRYQAFVRPALLDQWLKFDNESVTEEDVKKALEEQYGGEEELPNAYMLVYIRRSDVEKVICNVDDQEICEHLKVKLNKEQGKKMEMKKNDPLLYSIVKVARNEDLVDQIGRSIYFDLVDFDKVCCFRVQWGLAFYDFKEQVARELHIPSQFQRYWLCGKRQNDTCRPNRPLTRMEELQSVGYLGEVLNKDHNEDLKLFLEVEVALDLHPIQPPRRTSEDILVFIKLYDPIKEQLWYVGRLFFKASGYPIEILEKLNAMAGFSSTQKVKLYEEIKFEPNVVCEHIDMDLTFRENSIEDGAILCFQKSARVERGQQYRYPDVPLFLDYVHNRQVVHFRSLEKPKDDAFFLELSKLSTYDEVVQRVACHLGVHDPLKVRFTRHSCDSRQPETTPIMYRGVGHLSEMQVSNIMYYEVMDISEAGHQNRVSPCAICWSAPMEGACMPCGHMCSCMGCLNEIQSRNGCCPVCRGPIQQALRIYIA